VTARIIVVPGPGLDAAQCERWAAAIGAAVEVRAGDPVAVLEAVAGQRPGGAGDTSSASQGSVPAGVVIAPGVAAFDAPGLADAVAVAATTIPVVAVDPGNLRKSGVVPDSSRLAAAGACVIYGRGEDTGRHGLLYLARRHARRPDTLAYGHEPGQEGDLWLPAGDGPHPVAVLFHGGFWYHAWERDLLDGLAQDLARRGTAAWNVEYRRVGAGGGWPTTGEDAARATDHLVALAPIYGLDLGRVATVGHSAGAQLALWVAARGRRGQVHPALVVGLATIGDLQQAMTDRTGGGSVARLLRGGTDGADDRDASALELFLAEASPRARVPIGVPQILAHAADDDTVPLAQTTEYAAAARSAGDDVTVINLERGGHFSLIDPRSAAWAEVACAMQVRL
jgi:acetyl esterase/lipase